MIYTEKQQIVLGFLINKMTKIGGEGQTWTVQQQSKFSKESTEYVKKTLHLSKQESMKIVVKFIYKFGLKITNKNNNE